MSSLIPSYRSWDHAEVLVAQWEQASRQLQSAEGFYHTVVAELAEFSTASAALWAHDQNQPSCLAVSHRQLATDPPAMASAPQPDSFAPVASWATQQPARLDVRQRVCAESELVLQLRWSSADAISAADQSLRSTIADVARAAIEILSTVYLRQQLIALREQIAQADQRETAIAEIHRGATLQESFHNIAKGWARHLEADRVSILRPRGTRCELSTTSVHQSADRRSRLAHLLESLAAQSQHHDEPVSFTIGEPASPAVTAPASLQRYIIESGCRRIEIECVRDKASAAKPIAVIVSEWFTASTQSADLAFRTLIHESIRNAVTRDARAWTTLAQRLGHAHVRSKLALAGLLTAGSMLALCLIPARFTLPADGRVVPAVHRRLFAPAEAIVSRIAIRNGQLVKQGDELLTLRSSSIDLQDEQLRGELITARTQLASLGASRSGPTRGAIDTASDSLSISANEESLKAEIAGLEKQLALIAEQKQELSIFSPIDGKIDRWDLEQSLTMRPVAQGQYLVDVYSTDHAWVAELQLSDKHTGYLGNDDGVVQNVSLRMQARPDMAFQAKIVDIAKSAFIDPQGRSMVRLKCEFVPARPNPLAIGATVWAKIDCGHRPLGFVWFRGLIEWYERQSWY